jgi:hydrogenase nickel incorporation protein HypA/HybF
VHEYSITQSIINILDEFIKKNKIKTVKQVDFLLGPFANIDPDSISFYYHFLTENMPALKKARLVFKTSPILYTCPSCKRDFSLEKRATSCIFCGAKSTDLKEISDIKIISIDTL